MSMEKMEVLKCPKCGEKSEFRIWSSINTQLDPEMKEQVRTGEAFMFTCPYCGNTANVNYGFLYHQMEDQILIHYSQDEENFNQAYKLYTGEDELMKGELGINAFEGYLKRIVTSQNQLREKLLIFDMGLDDRIIEIIKLIYMAQMQLEHPELSFDEILFYTNQEKEKGIEFLNEGNYVANVKIDDAMYHAIVTEYGSNLMDLKEDDIVIDFNWALRLFDKHKSTAK